ncbi:MAG TPA: hypothetical protein VIL71_05330 [Spirillospora sp.]
MSGYGGSPPPGWQDPYGGAGSPGWGPEPYGQAPGGAYAPGAVPGQSYAHGYGPPGVPPATSSGSGSAVAALVCNIASAVLCCGILSIPGAVTAAIAMGRADTDPKSARMLTIWSWVLFVLSFVIGIGAIIAYLIAVFVAEGSGYDSTY